MKIEQLKNKIEKLVNPKMSAADRKLWASLDIEPSELKTVLEFHEGEAVQRVNRFYGMNASENEVLIFEDRDGDHSSDALINKIEKSGGLNGYELEPMTEYKVAVYRVKKSH
jgi:hypothetical protein